jgi:hypothetical protein
MFENLWQDLRYGSRMLIKKPSVTIAAVIALTLDIGASTAIVLLRPLPYQNSERIVRIGNDVTTRGLTQMKQIEESAAQAGCVRKEM